MKVCVYARVSSERQAEKDLSIPSQLKALKRYALERDWEVVAEYVDEAESARTTNRPKFKEMVAAAKRKSKPFEAILVWKLSRFARNREDSVIYKSLLKKHGVQVISMNEPVDSSPSGKLLEGMIEVIDEFYSTNLAEDVVRGMAENAGKGFFNGGSVTYGYRRLRVNVGGVQKSKLEPDATLAPVVTRVFQMALGGQGGKEIAKALNRDGLRTSNGKYWSGNAVNRILRNEIYTGSMVWRNRNGGVTRAPGAHQALVSGEDFGRLQHLLADRRPKVRHPRTVTSRYLLSPLLHCSYCGAPMIGCVAKSGKYAYYRCNNALRHGADACRSGWLPKQKIEDFVIEKLKERVLTDDNLSVLVETVNKEMGLLAGQRNQCLEQLEGQLKSVSQKLLKYYVAFEKGTMSDEDAAPRIRDLRAEQVRLQRARDEALAELEDSEPKELNRKQVLEDVSDLKSLLSTGTFMEQKGFLRSFIKGIDFEPGQVAINYTIPLPVGRGRTLDREVLSIGARGEPSRIRTPSIS